MADTWGCLGITKQGKPCKFGSNCRRKHPKYLDPSNVRAPEKCHGLTARGKPCRIARVSCPHHGDRAPRSQQVIPSSREGNEPVLGEIEIDDDDRSRSSSETMLDDRSRSSSATILDDRSQSSSATTLSHDVPNIHEVGKKGGPKADVLRKKAHPRNSAVKNSSKTQSGPQPFDVSTRKANRTVEKAERRDIPQPEEPEYLVTRLIAFRPEVSRKNGRQRGTKEENFKEKESRQLTDQNDGRGPEMRRMSKVLSDDCFPDTMQTAQKPVKDVRLRLPRQEQQQGQDQQHRENRKEGLAPEKAPSVEEIPGPTFEDQSSPEASKKSTCTPPASVSGGRSNNDPSTPNPNNSLELVKRATRLPHDYSSIIYGTDNPPGLTLKAHRPLASITTSPSFADGSRTEKQNRILTILSEGKEKQATPIDALRRHYPVPHNTEASKDPSDKVDPTKEVVSAHPSPNNKRQGWTNALAAGSLGSLLGSTYRTKGSKDVMDQKVSQAVSTFGTQCQLDGFHKDESLMRPLLRFLYEGLLFWSNQPTSR